MERTHNKAVNSDAFSFAALTTNAPVTAGVRLFKEYSCIQMKI